MRGSGIESKPVPLHKGGFGVPPFFLISRILFHFMSAAMCFTLSDDAYKDRIYPLS
ncbi:MAG: hypothetical protein OQK82_04675 [Candidatus Pacearchaeota archaeon]|nr:hypothetical protein [Candidatus Pacearchaeota archaeon]